MNRKQNNNRRKSGGDDGGGGYRRFGGTGGLGNYNRGAGHGHDNSRRSGHVGSDGGGPGNFTRSFDNNKSFDNTTQISPPHIDNNKDYERFQKFRDPNAYNQRNNHNNNWRSQHDGRRWNHGQRRGGGGRQIHYSNAMQQKYGSRLDWYDKPRDDNVVTKEQEEQPKQQATDFPTAVNTPTSNLPVTNTSVTNESQSENTKTADNGPTIPSLLDIKPLLKNIKQEKVAKDVSKQIGQPPPSSSSSESSSDDDELPTTQYQGAAKTKVIKTEPTEKLAKNVTNSSVAKLPKKIVQPPSSSSSSSSSSSEEKNEDDNEVHAPRKTVTKTAKVDKVTKSSKKSSQKKQTSEEDLICLGKLEKKFVIEDDVSDDTSVKTKTDNGNSICLICDKQGHTAFECQMICKNCSAPYHNMKNCPKPANLSIMMQTFMEFCLGQMRQFNPVQKFTLPIYMNANEKNLTKEPTVTPAAVMKKSKKPTAKPKEQTKKLVKRKRRITAKSSDEDEEDEEEQADEKKAEKPETDDEESSDSESESDSSEEIAVSKAKKKRTKAPANAMNTTEYPNTFIPPFSTFPTFGAAAAAYNPLLLSQLIHSGSFGTSKKLNYQ